MAKSVKFRGEISSSGIVNFDGKEARFIIRKAKPDFKSALSNDNVKLAKHAIFQSGTWEDGSPKLTAVLKISKDCIRQAMFFDDQPFHNPAIIYAPKLLIKAIASPVGILRGYMYPDVGVKKSSPIYMSDAVQTSNNVSTIDFGSTHMTRDEKVNPDDESGTSIHYKESIGGIVTYGFEGSLHLTELQFISLSEMHDRLGVDPNYLVDYLKNLETFLGDKTPEKAFYVMKTAAAGLPEEGLLFSPIQVRTLVEAFFTRLINLEICRGASGRAWLSNLEVGIKSRGLEEPVWNPVKSIEDVMAKIPPVEPAYAKFNEEEALALYEKFSTGKAKSKEAKSERKKAKAEKAEKPTKA